PTARCAARKPARGIRAARRGRTQRGGNCSCDRSQCRDREEPLALRDREAPARLTGVDVTDEADRDLSRLYRAGAREEPPPWLDAKLIAAAAEASRPARGGARVLSFARWGTHFA